jgi:hypothetical protein
MAASDGRIAKENVEQRPWPIELASYCSNPISGTPTIWPWPNEDWSFNRFALDAMQVTHFMDRLLQKDGNKWEDEEKLFYKTIYEEPEIDGNPNSL